jgi:hypothetical protein
VPIDQLKIISRHPGPLVEDENIYQVRRIINHRIRDGAKEYLIDWLGYNEHTWEPEQNILDQGAVSEYWKRLKEKNSSNNHSNTPAAHTLRSTKRAQRR